MRLLFLVLAALLTPAVVAQTAGSCAYGVAQAVLDVNDVRAAVFNTGALFYGNTTTVGNGYYVPKGTQRSPIFAAALWLGGQVGGEVRVAAGRYDNFQFWPGPLADGGLPPDPQDCSAYDRIYSVTRDDVFAYLRTGVATDDLRDWPADLGAPVLDGDGVAGNYNLAGGDQPALAGDGVAWWLMNDAGNVHLSPQSDPLGVEVRAEAFAVADPRLDQITFYRYAITNRNAQPIDSLYVGVFVDTDLGNAVDDYAATDTTLGTIYTYNADEDDDGSTGYGIPPAVGLTILAGPVGLANGRDDDRDGTVDEPGERLDLAAAPWISKGISGPTIDPFTSDDYMYRLQGRFNDGTVMREFGSGYGQPATEPVTLFYRSGDPVTESFWSAENTDRLGTTDYSGDARMAAGVGPFRLAPGETDTLAFAVTFAQGTDRLDSVVRLRGVAERARAVYRAGAFAPRRLTLDGQPPLPEPSEAVRLGRPSPNPVGDGGATVRYEVPAGTPMRAVVLDVLGREVAVLHDGPVASATGTLALGRAGLAAGVYRLVVRVPAGEAVRSFVVTGR